MCSVKMHTICWLKCTPKQDYTAVGSFFLQLHFTAILGQFPLKHQYLNIFNQPCVAPKEQLSDSLKLGTSDASNTYCLCGVPSWVKGRAQPLSKQDFQEITIHQAQPEAQLWYHLQDLYDGISSHHLLHLVKHLAAVKLSWCAELECTCLQYQLLLNITGIAGMLRSLQGEASAERLSRLAEQHLLQPLLNFYVQEGQEWESTKGLQEPRPQSAPGLPPPHQTPYSAFQEALGGQPFRALCLGFIPQFSCRTSIKCKVHPPSMLSLLRHQGRAEPPLFSAPSPQPPSYNSQNQLWWTVWSWLGSGHIACFLY